MQTHDIKRIASNKKARTVGRGGRRGKTSGRGTKGQKARAGHKIRPMIRDVIKKLPKLRGRGIHPNKPVSRRNAVLNVVELGSVKGSPVTPEVLVKEGFVRRVDGRVPVVKILGSGEISKAVIVKGCGVSAEAKKKIETAGGEIK